MFSCSEKKANEIFNIYFFGESESLVSEVISKLANSKFITSTCTDPKYKFKYQEIIHESHTFKFWYDLITT
jgi:hypothetical protein